MQVKTITKVNDQVFLNDFAIPDGYKPLQTVIQQSRKKPLSDSGIRQIIMSLCSFIKNLTGLVMHLDPNAIYINPGLDHAIVACGDARAFDNWSVVP